MTAQQQFNPALAGPFATLLLAGFGARVIKIENPASSDPCCAIRRTSAQALVLAHGFSATNQVYAIAGQVMRGRETGPVMGLVSLGAGMFGYLGPQMLGVLRDWTGGFDAGWYISNEIASGSVKTVASTVH